MGRIVTRRPRLHASLVRRKRRAVCCFGAWASALTRGRLWAWPLDIQRPVAEEKVVTGIPLVYEFRYLGTSLLLAVRCVDSASRLKVGPGTSENARRCSVGPTRRTYQLRVESEDGHTCLCRVSVRQLRPYFSPLVSSRTGS